MLWRIFKENLCELFFSVNDVDKEAKYLFSEVKASALVVSILSASKCI
jgi:hypothetical protein